MVPVFARPVLATPTRAFIPDMLPGLASPARCAAYLDYLYYLDNLNNSGKLDDIDHNINNQRLHQWRLHHQRHNRPQLQRTHLGYIDIGIKGYHLGSLSSSRFRIMLQSQYRYS